MASAVKVTRGAALLARAHQPVNIGRVGYSVGRRPSRLTQHFEHMKKANPNGVAKSSVKHVKPNPNAKPGKYFREDPLERIPEGYGSYSGNTSVRSVQHPEWVENSFRRPLERLAYETTVDMYPLLAVPAKFGGSAAYEWAERQGVQIVEKHSRRGGKFAEFAKDYKFSASKGKANAKTSKLPDGPDLEMVDADGSTNTPTRDSSRRQPSSSRSMAVQVSRKRKSSASAGMSARSAAMFGSRTGAYRSKSTGPYARRGAKGGYTKGRSTRVALGAGRTLPWKVRGKMMPIAFITAGNDMPDGTATSGTAGAMALPSDFILNTVVQSTTPAGGAVTQGFYWCPKLSDFSAANEMAAIADSYCINKATMKLMPSINSASAAGATLPTLWCIPVRTKCLRPCVFIIHFT